MDREVDRQLFVKLAIELPDYVFAAYIISNFMHLQFGKATDIWMDARNGS